MLAALRREITPSELRNPYPFFHLQFSGGRAIFLYHWKHKDEEAKPTFC